MTASAAFTMHNGATGVTRLWAAVGAQPAGTLPRNTTLHTDAGSATDECVEVR